MIGHIVLHFLPKIENGSFNNDDGLLIPSKVQPDSEHQKAHNECIWFAMGLLMPKSETYKALEKGNLDTIFPLHKPFVEARVRSLLSQ